ncbi:UPF0553 C9orf64-like protein [Labeo rohita]|uniref:UPF0553 C9orf64-like protein n=1 Tax=Labeo rohita TaxID=84645 RepID=A0A498P2S7_LABRO|nr:UPF0553 C9orf64-like protein [Labeo rohita]
MEKALSPRESSQFVAERSRDVFVDEDGVKRVAQMIYELRESEEFTASGWKMMNPLAPSPDSDEAINWVFVTDTMNFSFWPEREEEQCEVVCRGNTYRGYMSLCAAVTRAMDEGVPITNPTYFSQISEAELAKVLRSDSDTPMPMLKERHQALTEAGRVLMEHGGSFRVFMSHCENDAEKMVKYIVENIPSYRDEATYEGKRISFYKRAQILVADFWGIMEARGEGNIPNLDYLTMFADYRVPQGLVYLGALRYSDALMETLKNEIFSSGRGFFQLRSLAFKKIPQKSTAPPSTLTLQDLANDLVSPAAVQQGSKPQESWQEWKQRDEQLTSDLYEADLEKALMLSKLEFEQHKKDAEKTETASPKAKAGGKKDKKKNQQGKDKRVTVSLKDFQQEGGVDQLNKKPDREPVNPALRDDKFFNQLEDDVSRIVQRDKRREQYSNSAGHEVNTSSEQEQDVRTEQLKYELEKKDQEIVKLKKTISQWEDRYKEVKARNAQLLKMLQQGEMKDKAEILLQVEELQNIKEELSSQVTQLHTALEQERSKVKGLQSEQPKHQGNRKGKKASDGDV